MTYQIKETPNGRVYMWSDGAEQGWRCSPYFRDIDTMAMRSKEIQGSFNGEWTSNNVKYLACSLISGGYLTLPKDKTPSWAREILPGVDPTTIQIGDEAYFRDEDDIRRRMLVVNEVKQSSGARKLCGDFRGQRLVWRDQFEVWKCKPSPYALGDLVGYKRFYYSTPYKITKIYPALWQSDGTINFKSNGWAYDIEETKEYSPDYHYASEDELRPWKDCKR